MTAFAGTYSDFKLVKTRGVAQVVIEIPLEKAQTFIAAHGLPDGQAEKWFGIAAINPGAAQNGAQPKKEDDPGKRAVKRAVLLCKDQAFQDWANAVHFKHLWGVTELAAKQMIYDKCGIASRSELATNEEARRKFEALETSFRYRDQIR